MRILLILHDNSINSGATKSMCTIAEQWIENGISVIIAVPGGGKIREYLRDKGIRVLEIPKFYTRVNYDNNIIKRSIQRIVSVLSIAYMYIYSYKFKKLIKNEKIDIVYSNTSTVLLGHFIREIACVKHVWHLREFGRKDQNCDFSLGNKLLYKMISRSDLVITISKSLFEFYSSYIKRDMLIVYNDISKEYIDYFKRNWFSKEIVLLSCGSLIQGKGHIDVIRAVHFLREKGLFVRLKIAGDGDQYKDYLKEEVRKLKAENYVEFLGQVDDMRALRRECHIGVVASKMEAFGRVTIEGMLSGLAMVGADSGATSELITSGFNGLKYKPEDYRELATCIDFLYHDRNLMYSIATNGFNDSLKYTNGNAAITILSNLSKLIEG